MKKWSCGALQNSVPVPQELALQGVSPLSVAYALLDALFFRPLIYRGSLYLLWEEFGSWPECGAF